MGLPKRVIRRGIRVFCSRLRISKQLRLNAEMGISLTLVLFVKKATDTVFVDLNWFSHNAETFLDHDVYNFVTIE